MSGSPTIAISFATFAAPCGTVRQTCREVEVGPFEYINDFCNPRRKHSAIGWKSPVAFDQRAAQHERLTGTKPVQVQ